MDLKGRGSAALTAAALSLAALGRVRAMADCPPGSPVLTGPQIIQAGSSYAVYWTDVLDNSESSNGVYVIQRSVDPTFSTILDATATTQSAYTLPGAPAGLSILYHRVLVQSSCPTASPVAIVSNTLAVAVQSTCQTPPGMPPLTATPASPPALTSYVVAWTAVGNVAGPGGGDSNPGTYVYRLQRTTAAGTQESVSSSTSATFNDPPGVYLYQARAEATCGAVGEWSEPLEVTVANPPQASLVLMSEPQPVFLNPAGWGSTTFAVRNAGTTDLAVTSASSLSWVQVSPATFDLQPGASQAVTLTAATSATVSAPSHGDLTLTYSGGFSLDVPVTVVTAPEPAAASVVFGQGEADVDAAGDPVQVSLINPGSSPATIAGTISDPWITVADVTGKPWDRPMAGAETRLLQIGVDRTKRSAVYGTETGTVVVSTQGDAVASTLVVVDDGPKIPPTGQPGGSTAAPLSRILFASLPNGMDSRGVGWYTADVWLSNSDAVSPIAVTLLFRPVNGGPAAEPYRADLQLGPGETRRFRNVVGNIAGYPGACSLEVRSPSPTLSATALVNSQPLAAVMPGVRRSQLLASARPQAGGQLDALTTVSAASLAQQFGFEMRPTAPGEGAQATDPVFVVSGLAHDPQPDGSGRRSNLLLFETSGYDTQVQLSLLGQDGKAIAIGIPVLVTVPAGQTIQINDGQLFVSGAFAGPYFYVKVQFVSGFTDTAGVVHGSVVPMATVIDDLTQDASLRVGVSTAALDPTKLPPSPSSGVRGPLAGTNSALPFGGGPAPLFFAVVHAGGAALAGGKAPFWRTRVTFTNVGQSQRTLVLRLLDQSGNVDRLGLLQQAGFFVSAGTVNGSFDDILRDLFLIPEDVPVWGGIEIVNVPDGLGGFVDTWKDVDVQTEVYTDDPKATAPPFGEYRTGMEAFTYLHGYSSFQSNLGTLQFEGAENSTQYRTNLILQEVGGAPCTVAVAVYLAGSFVPTASTSVNLPAYGYISADLFATYLGLTRNDLVDARVVVRQTDGTGVFMAFASRINLASGDPANIFLRPAAAGTGR